MKRLLLFIAIAVVIGVGILVLQPYRQNQTELQQPNTQTQEDTESNFALNEQTIRSAIPSIVGSQFNATTATYFIANIGEANAPAVVIGAIEQGTDLSTRPVTATIQIVHFTSTTEYERIGRVDYQEWMRGTPEVKELRDLTDDGVPEIIASLQYGGASSWAEGIIQLDRKNNRANWLQLQNKQNQTQDAIFLLAGSAGHWNSIQFQDVNGNGRQELIELFAQVLPFENEEVVCEANVYIWNGNTFAYAQSLSEQILSSLSANCEL